MVTFRAVERLSVGNGGWVRSREVGANVWVRLVDDDGRLVPVDLFLEVDEPHVLDAKVLRRVPLGRIEAAANAPDNAKVIRRRMLHHAVPSIGDTLKTVARPRAVGPDVGEWQPLILAVPKTRPYPSDFYGFVAAAYFAAAEHTPAPAVAIAEANGIPVKTVHRWIAEARTRGLLPPGRPGKAG